jgi:hypothetical protein
MRKKAEMRVLYREEEIFTGSNGEKEFCFLEALASARQ